MSNGRVGKKSVKRNRCRNSTIAGRGRESKSIVYITKSTVTVATFL